jgi:hypothetical protein
VQKAHVAELIESAHLALGVNIEVTAFESARLVNLTVEEQTQ